MIDLIGIEKRNRGRASAIEAARKLKAPVLTDEQAKKDFDSCYKDQRSDLLENCHLVVEDFGVLLRVGRMLADKCRLDFETEVRKEGMKVRLSEEDQDVLNRRRTEEAEAELKEAKARGDVPGQMKMVKDDGTIAEAASAVKVVKDATVKLEVVEPN